jgi:exonuclease III
LWRVGHVFPCIPMDPSHILFWNVRGLNYAAMQNADRTFINSARVDVICLQETKMCHFDRRSVLYMFGADFDNNFVYLPYSGASEGVLISWRSRMGVVVASRVDSFSATVQFSSNSGDALWLTVVYGPQGNGNKIAFLQEL